MMKSRLTLLWRVKLAISVTKCIPMSFSYQSQQRCTCARVFASSDNFTLVGFTLISTYKLTYRSFPAISRNFPRRIIYAKDLWDSFPGYFTSVRLYCFEKLRIK